MGTLIVLGLFGCRLEWVSRCGFARGWARWVMTVGLALNYHHPSATLLAYLLNLPSPTAPSPLHQTPHAQYYQSMNIFELYHT